MVEKPFSSLERYEIQVAVFSTEEVLIYDHQCAFIEEGNALFMGRFTQLDFLYVAFTEGILLEVGDKPGLAITQQNQFFLVRTEVCRGDPAILLDPIARDFDTVQQLSDMFPGCIGDL